MKDEFFGIEALNLCFSHFLSLNNASIGQHGQNWQDKNIQAKKAEKKSPICPYYNLIEFYAEIMGIKPEELADFDYFCGTLEKNIIPSRVPDLLSGSRIIPFRCCSAIRYIMHRAIKLAKTKKPKSITQISESPSEDEKEKIQEFFEADRNFKTGQQILNLWRKTIPKNIGTKEIKYSDKDLILQVENLLKQLEERAAGNFDTIHIFTGFGEQLHKIPCESAPKYEHNPGIR